MLKGNSDLKSHLKSGKREGFLSKPDRLFLSLNKIALEEFQNLKKAFCEEPVLRYFHITKGIRLETYVSGKAIDSVLAK